MNSELLRSITCAMALLASSLGMAATVTIVPSTVNPNVGDTFTLTVSGDVGNTFAATLGLGFDASKVAYVSGTTTGAWTVFTKNSLVTANPTVFDIETPTATAASPGTYNAAILTFQALAGGAANILINDDGGNVSGWFDADTADYIPVTYTQANVTVTAVEPNMVVTDTVVPADDLAVAFGQVTEMTTSSTQTVTVTNSGNQDLVLGTVALADALAAPFAVVSDSCSGQTLTPSSSCNLGLEFSPPSTGDFPDTFDIPSNDPDEPSVTVSVSGTGTAMPVPNILVTDSVAPATDSQVGFGSVVLNQTGTQTLLVTNNGYENLTIGLLAVANPLLAPFSITSDTCSSQILTPAQNCTVQLQFQPTAVGPFSDSLDIPSDDPDAATVTVAVSGSGAALPVPDIVVTDSVNPAADLQVDFGDVRLPGTADETVTVRNAGTASLGLGNVAAANPLAAPFSITMDNCSGQSLAPDGGCTITVVFAPGAIQPFNESFDIPSNDPDDPNITIAVSGSGMPELASGGGSSGLDPGTLLVLGVVGWAARRRRCAPNRTRA